MSYELDDLKELVRGQTYSKELEFLDDSEKVIPLFGSSLYFLLKDSPRNLDTDAALSVSIVLPDNAESKWGKATLVIPSNAWSGVASKQYYWSLVRVVTGDTPQLVYPHSSGKVNLVKAALGEFA